MVRRLTPDRQILKAQAIVLRKMGWTQQHIADQISIPRTTIRDWFGDNGMPAIIAKKHRKGDNAKLDILAKPTFLSWCGRLEDFTPTEDIKFDLIIADPPWNVSRPNEIKRRAGKPVKKNFGMWDFFNTEDDYLRDINKWLQRLFELSQNPSWCWFWCSYRYLSYIATLAETIGWEVHNWYVWGKPNPAPLMGANNFLQAIEPVLILRRGNARLRFDNGHLPNHHLLPLVSTRDRIKDIDGNVINLAQKPVTLLSLIVIWCSEPGQWVLDAFAGSGSASVSALKGNRNCYAVELDQSQLTIIQGRLQKEGLI